MEAEAPMQPFAILLESPSAQIGEDRGGIGWTGLGPHSVPIIVRGDGIVIFDFLASSLFADGGVPAWQPACGKAMPRAVADAERRKKEIAYNRFRYVNAWIAAYMSGMSAVQHHGIITPPPADPQNHLKAVLHNGQWLAFGSDGKVRAGAVESTKIKIEVFDCALTLLNAAQRIFGNEFTVVLSLFQLASYHYQSHQFATSHLLAWAICEQVLNNMWNEYQDGASSRQGGGTKISKKRSELLNGRDFTASIVTQILSLAGVIDDELLTKLDTARKNRNAFAHSLKVIDESAAQQAMIVASDLLSLRLGQAVSPQLSTGYWI
jgi:hypothetical protein